MYKKITILILAIMTTLSFTACGTEKEIDPVETEPPIVARQETLTTATDSNDNTETASTEATEAAESSEAEPMKLVYDDGIELANIKLADATSTISVKSGENLDALLNATGLKYISWSSVYTDVSAINFSGEGYALHDVVLEQDFAGDYSPTMISLQVSDKDGNRANILEEDKAQYRVAGIKASYEEDDSLDYTVIFAGGVTVGMTKEDIENTLGAATEGDDALYIVDGNLALYVDYNFDDVAENIYAVPATLVNTPEE